MLTKKRYSVKDMFLWSIGETLVFLTYASLITYLYEILDFTFLDVPWTPVALIGTAVAFMVGFQNNAAYDRIWEARKIWGGIVNSSRSWGSMIKGFVTDEFVKEESTRTEVEELRKQMIYRQIAWLYRLKRQLRVVKPWEHDKSLNKKYRKFISDLFPSEDPETELLNFLPAKEVEHLLSTKNVCIQLLDKQSEELE